jgi:hypothetical protein
VEAKEIFDLIIKADEALKYATEEKATTRVGQAREWLTRARDEALAAGIDGLVEQAERRLADLEALGTGSAGD